MKNSLKVNWLKIKDSKIVLYTLFITLALLWGLSFFGTKVALKELEPIEVLAVRWLMSLVLFGILVVTKVIKISYKGKPVKLLMLAAFLQPCIYAYFEAWGIDLTTASESSLFIAVIPLMVIIEGALVFRKAIPLKVALGILLGFSGVIICVAFSPSFSVGGRIEGYIYLLIAVCVGAMYTLVSHKLAKSFSAMEVTFFVALEGAIFFNGIAFYQGYGLHPYEVFFSGGAGTISLIYLGIGCSFMAYLIFNFTLSKLSAALATCIQTNLITAVGVLAGIIWGGDNWGWYTVVGLILIIFGIFESSRGKEEMK